MGIEGSEGTEIERILEGRLREITHKKSNNWSRMGLKRKDIVLKMLWAELTKLGPMDSIDRKFLVDPFWAYLKNN